MALPIAVNDKVRLAIVCDDQSAQIGINVSFWNVDSISAGAPTDQQLVDSFSTGFSAFYKPCLAPACRYYGAMLNRVSPGATTSTVFSGNGRGVGTATGDNLPRQTSGIITLKTAFAGRRYRGRVYIPFPAEADNDAVGNPTAGYVTRLGLLAAQYAGPLVHSIGGGTVVTSLLVRSRKFGLWTPVIATIARVVWATQRRRGSYGRTNQLPF